MNIFEIYKEKIKNLIIDLNKKNTIKIPKNLDHINVDIPPDKFNADISSNAAMVIGKFNQINPMDLGNIIKRELIVDEFIQEVEIVKPGFINVKLKQSFWNKFLEEVIKKNHLFGFNNKEKKIKYHVEFVSANPTGPLHVGHCRGAV